MASADTVPASLARPPKSAVRDFVEFLVKLVVAVLLLRSLVVATFNIPSESMMPRLFIGDYLLVEKWPYGISRYSFPIAPPFRGRLFERLPTRGDVAVFKDPAGASDSARRDIVKRVIGLPGETVQMRRGSLYLNGIAVPKVRIEDFVAPVTPNSPCFTPEFAEAGSDGATRCRYPRYRETLPGGRSYDVLDLGETTADDTRVFTVPADHLFMMGDNRDRSGDSRFAAVEGAGVGFVPVENLVGRAGVSVFSTDGSAWWVLPWTWVSAARWNRIGRGF